MTVLAWATAFLMGLHGVAGGQTVEADGEASVSQATGVSPREVALAAALKHCVEQVVGTTLKNEFSSEQQSTLQGHEEVFWQNVRDRVQQNTQGFIDHYEILQEAVVGQVVRIKVRATVFDSQVKAEVHKLGALLAAVGNPKLMLVVQEYYDEPNGTAHVASTPILADCIAAELAARGFQLAGVDDARKIATQNFQSYDTWMANPQEFTQTARNSGADVLIFGRVQIKNLGETAQVDGLDALQGQVRVEITSLVRGINVSSGELLSVRPVQLRSFGLNEERAVHRAFRGRGQSVVTQVFGDLLLRLQQSFEKSVDAGQAYSLQLDHVSDFHGQAENFLQLLQQVQGVTSLTERSFDPATGLAVDLVCRCTTTELQQRIFALATQSAALKSLDVTAVAGKRLHFIL